MDPTKDTHENLPPARTIVMVGAVTGLIVGTVFAVAEPIRVVLSMEQTVSEVPILISRSFVVLLPAFLVAGVISALLLCLLGRISRRAYQLALSAQFTLLALAVFGELMTWHMASRWKGYLIAAKCAVVALLVAVPSYVVLRRFGTAIVNGRAKRATIIVMLVAAVAWGVLLTWLLVQAIYGEFPDAI